MPDQIRALRGARSRAELARLLGVTPLTVLRWELPVGTKEARRPRRAMIEALARLGGAGPAPTAVTARGADGRAPEPPASAPAAVDAPRIAPEDEMLLLPALQRLGTEAWPRAENELVTLLASSRLRTAPARALATLGIAQVQMLARFEVRSAFAALLPLLAEAEAGRLPVAVAARAHVMGALLFGAPDARLFDPGRANAHAARAEQLLDPNAADLRGLLAVGRLSVALILGPHVFTRIYEALLPSLDGAAEPVTRCILEELRAVAAQLRGDGVCAARHGASALEQAERLGLSAVVATVLAGRAWRGLLDAITPEEVLSITRRARAAADAGGLAPGELLLRVLGCECLALIRLGRLDDAAAALRQGHALAARAGIPPYAITASETRLHSYRHDSTALDRLADVLEKAEPGPLQSLVDGCALHARAVAASLRADHARAAELADLACEALDRSAVGDFLLVLDAHIEAIGARLLSGDLPAARARLRRLEAVLDQHPAAWYAALARRMDGILLLQEGELDAAGPKLDASLAAFTLLGDVMQCAIGRAVAAAVASAAGAPDGDERIAAATEKLQCLGITLRPLLARDHGRALRAGAAGADLPRTFTERLSVAVERLLVRGGARAGRDVEPLTEPEPDLPDFIAAAPATRRLRREIAQLSGSNATLLITGQSGAGKEVVARAVHDLSARAGRAYVVFNCASIPRDLFEAQLFGYRRGAFTGASSDHAGIIGAADKGTLVLDEVGELPLDVQPKLLRFLENGEVFPLGEPKPRRVDVRVLAATHRDLGKLVREGAFREDLYYRLNVVPLHVPPLRERTEDIVALARRFVARLTPDGAEPPTLAPDALAALTAHTWPGNVRELRNVIERALAFGPPPPVLRAEHMRITFA